MIADDTSTRDELNALVDCVMGQGNVHNPVNLGDIGFRAYAIRGIYVSPEVVEQAIIERLEKMNA